MYTAYIGKKLIAAVNSKEGKEYTERTFFDKVFFPCFFANERFLLDTNLAPPGQAYKQKGKTPLTQEVIEAQRIKIHEKIDAKNVDSSIYLGGSSSDAGATTSGQVTSLLRAIPPEDVYASWIGTGLGATVEGGLSLLIDDDEALLAIYEGWGVYRELLDTLSGLKPHQINTWNGQWLAYRLGRDWNPAANHAWDYNADGTALNTQTWVQLLFSLSYHYRKTADKTLTSYVYAFGQMNRTLGFIRMNLPEVIRIAQLYAQLFPDTVSDNNHAYDQLFKLYKTEFGFKRASEAVSIGTRALQPKDLRQYIEGKIPAYNASDAEKRIYFEIQETWILAMLKNNDLNTRAEELALALREATKDNRGRMVNIRKVDEVIGSKSRREFIENLTLVLTIDSSENGELFNQIVEEVILMPTESVPLFLTLLRFKYAYVTRKAGNTPATATTESES